MCFIMPSGIGHLTGFPDSVVVVEVTAALWSDFPVSFLEERLQALEAIASTTIHAVDMNRDFM
jgi:hypothetical protein